MNNRFRYLLHGSFTLVIVTYLSTRNLNLLDSSIFNWPDTFARLVGPTEPLVAIVVWPIVYLGLLGIIITPVLACLVLGTCIFHPSERSPLLLIYFLTGAVLIVLSFLLISKPKFLPELYGSIGGYGNAKSLVVPFVLMGIGSITELISRIRASVPRKKLVVPLIACTASMFTYLLILAALLTTSV